MKPTFSRRRTDEVVRMVDQDVRSGGYEPGDRYLSVRQIAEQYSISPNTAQRVMQTLVDRDVLEIRPRIGTFVEGEGLTLVHPDGRREELQPEGWEHQT